MTVESLTSQESRLFDRAVQTVARALELTGLKSTC